jgi:hypothetical protein
MTALCQCAPHRDKRQHVAGRPGSGDQKVHFSQIV